MSKRFVRWLRNEDLVVFVGRSIIGYDDNRPTYRVVSVFRRQRKRSAVSKEQNTAIE